MAVTGGINPVYPPGLKVSFAADAAITQGTFVEVTGQMEVGPAAAGSRKVVGFALQTAGAAGDIIPVQLIGYIVRATAEGAVTAGDELIIATGAGNEGHVSSLAAAAAGDAADVNNARAVVGIALEDIADEGTGRVLVRV